MFDREFPILLFEDSDDDAFLLERALKKAGIANPIHRVADGEQGISYLSGAPPYDDRARHPFPSIVLLDLKMPRKGGIEVLDWLKTHPEHRVIPTIVFTASREQQDVAAAYSLGANCFITKPSRFDDLEQLVRVLRDFWSWCEKPRSK